MKLKSRFQRKTTLPDGMDWKKMKIKKKSSPTVEQQNVITTASHTARTATLNINPIQTYVTHSLPRWIKKNIFFFPASLHVCLKRTHAAVKTRSSCGCITGAVAASKQAADKKKKNVQTLESIAIHRCYQQYSPPPSPPFSRPPKWHQVCCPPPASFLCVAK